MVVEEAMAARIKVDTGVNRTAVVAEAVEEEVAAADMVEVALIGVVVEVATEVAVEVAWGRCLTGCCGRGSGFLIFFLSI